MTEIEHEIPIAVADEIASWFSVVGASPRNGRDIDLLRRAAVELWKTSKISHTSLNGGAVIVQQEIVDALQRMAEHIGISADDAQLIIARAKEDTDATLFPPRSLFGAVRFVDIDRVARPLQWTIQDVLQRATLSLWYGAPSSGKSFLLTDAALSIARGMPWMGYRTHRGLVIYQTGEGGDGFGLRLKAYRQHANIEADDDLPIIYLPKRINLFSDDTVLDNLIAEVKAWSAFYDMPPEFIAIDTFNAASGGANENANQDVARVLDRCRRLIELGAHVAVVHHTPASGGRPRGHSSLTGDVETTLSIEETEQVDSEETADGHLIRRTVRSWTLVKQKDGPAHVTRTFVLKAVKIGVNEFGDNITSCIVARLNTAAIASKTVSEGYVVIHPANDDIFRSLVRALRKNGVASPEGSNAPRGTLCVTVGQWQDEMLEAITGHEPITDKIKARIKQRVWRASKGWLPDRVNLIAKNGAWVWRTTRKVHGVDPPPMARVEAAPLLAPGETAKDVGDLLGKD